MNNIKIVHVNTKTFRGMYIPERKRIEISSYIKKYPDLHKHILEHELKHHKNKDLHGSWSFLYDILLEFRAEYKEVFNEKIRIQLEEYNKEFEVGLKETITNSIYYLSYPFYKWFGDFLLFFILLRRSRK